MVAPTVATAAATIKTSLYQAKPSTSTNRDYNCERFFQ
jgi:hypothetical protein